MRHKNSTYDKADTAVNGTVTEQVLSDQRKKEKRLYTLRVNDTTVLLVPEEKCNDEYREWYRVNRMGFRPSVSMKTNIQTES